MKVILNSDVENLGEEGDVLDVAPGYARNFLLPKGLVLAYNKRNVATIEERRESIEKRKEAKRTEAMGLKERLESSDLAITMTAGRNGKLFGSVTSATIVEHLAATGVEIERKRIEVPDKTIKATGNYKVKVRLYGGAEAVLTVKVEADSVEEPPKESSPVEEERSEVETVEEHTDEAIDEDGYEADDDGYEAEAEADEYEDDADTEDTVAPVNDESEEEPTAAPAEAEDDEPSEETE